MLNRKMPDRIRRYVESYYETLRQQLAKYHAIADDIPEFLKGCRRVVAVLGSDGLVIAHYLSNHDTFQFGNSNSTMKAIVESLTGDPFRFDYAIGVAVDLKLAEAVIRDDSTGSIIWSAPWAWLEASSNVTAARWSEQAARVAAIEEVQQFVAA